MTRVLLTGATGRVGARFIPYLRNQGVTLRLAVWNPAMLAGAPSRPELVVGDLTDRGVCAAAAAGVDAVVHIASAFVGVSAKQAEELNRRATATLAQAALDAGVRRFVQMSSYLVYRATLGRPAREDDELRGDGAAPFSADKLGSERAVAAFAGTALEVCVLRVAFTYGEGDPHLVDAFGWAQRSSPHRRLHLVHHADVRQSVLHGLTGAAIGVFNIGDDAPATAAELAALAEDYFSPHAESDDAAQFDADSFEGEVDTSLARSRLGFRPRFPSIQAAARAGAM
jgi:UDP-glucose 4-epimerase